jgi:CHAT domain-containing protein
VTAPLSILAMTASPKDWKQLDLQRERELLEEALKPLQDKGQVKLTWLAGHGWLDLQKAMRRGPWHIFHFIGHGGFSEMTQEGLIALEDEEGKAYRLYATRLSQLLTDHYSLHLVVLNSCEGAKGNDLDVFSSTAATLVRNGIPAVLAMQHEITDKAAMALSRAFYDALAEGWPVDMAVSEARKAINLEIENTLEWGTPHRRGL